MLAGPVGGALADKLGRRVTLLVGTTGAGGTGTKGVVFSRVGAATNFQPPLLIVRSGLARGPLLL